MGKLRKPFVILFILALLLPVAAGAQDQPTTLRVGTTYIMDTINPANGFYGYNIRPLWQDTLVEWAGGQNFEPGLAENWSVSDDGLVWQFKIREGVTYSDGAPLTANEVAWSLNWVIDNEIPSMISYLSNIETVEALDPTTLQMTLGAPVPDMISAKLLFVWIVAPQVWENISGDDITTYSEYDAVLGSGPYMLTDFQEGEYMIMDANPNYWGGKPPVDRIIYQEYANDDAMIQALLAGEI
ncbi:MAG: ABC transporter substrate-binding protein, partial [Anaerolineae bacterium]|nr:ABC transporter substrate-binding protein [Anaerolineae bacterium]